MVLETVTPELHLGVKRACNSSEGRASLRGCQERLCGYVPLAEVAKGPAGSRLWYSGAREGVPRIALLLPSPLRLRPVSPRSLRKLPRESRPGGLLSNSAPPSLMTVRHPAWPALTAAPVCAHHVWSFPAHVAWLPAPRRPTRALMPQPPGWMGHGPISMLLGN